jgi:hypothetical protein
MSGRRLSWIAQAYSSSFFAGLRTFFKTFFKKNDPIKLFTSVKKKIELKQPGERLWENDDIRIDRGETLADGATNIVWQRQAQTKEPALKKITDTHSKIVTQEVSPKSDPAHLKDDFFDKLK